MVERSFDISAVRAQFPGLSRRVADRAAVFLDGPAGSQVPRTVAETMSAYLLGTNANHGGIFDTSRESDAILDAAHWALADFVGASDPEEIVFGANMTTLTFALSRALSRTWRAGDEIIVTSVDHDANVTPWVLAARDVGALVRQVDLRPEDATLDMADLDRKLSPRTRLVAVAAASNLTGGIQPIREITRRAHAVGAEIWVDAVHFAPHRRIDVTGQDVDWLVASPYKFFGPHLGVLWGRRSRLEALEAYKVRTSPRRGAGKWMTGTQSHEAIAGAAAAIEYLADLGRAVLGTSDACRPMALDAAYDAIGRHELDLTRRALDGLRSVEGLRIHGISELDRLHERVATISFTLEGHAPADIAQHLAEEGVFVWSGNSYALPVTQSLGLEPDGVVRAGFLHYNTTEEVDRLVSAVRSI